MRSSFRCVTHRKGRQRGSTLVDFLAALMILVTIFLGGVQLGLYVYARNVATAAAAEGARYGAPEGRGEAAASRRTNELLDYGLGNYRNDLSVKTASDGGFVVVTVTGTLPAIVPFLEAIPLTVSARSFEERRPAR